MEVHKRLRKAQRSFYLYALLALVLVGFACVGWIVFAVDSTLQNLAVVHAQGHPFLALLFGLLTLSYFFVAYRYLFSNFDRLAEWFPSNRLV